MPAVLSREYASWNSFALLDSGDGEKCERFGDVVMIRPEPQALWKKSDEDIWQSAHLKYARQGREGEWIVKKDVPNSWNISWEELTFRLRPTSFKHTGLFPEQSSNWAWLQKTIVPGMRVLNLFGYTGGATLAAASAGGVVTHVDASKPVVTWGKENAELSNLQDRSIRWIIDDVCAFVKREIRRGNVYDGICMDPPAFGRGPNGELWQFETHLPTLISDCVSLLNEDSGFFLLNAYSLGFPALALENVLQAAIPWNIATNAVELTLQEESERQFLLPTGVAIRCGW